ncbi:IPT/TIG domain-containing protein [Telluribacter sp.]|jgi:hypothetical protein|uniref:IPT/TIG domain-containing protein n=1 Tax=Telluribacter sp. TaxID=1978767 RepID=UPI002E0EA553|nr:IPT/TIG domain-containing protein [Telluribacter sp.]
MSVKITHSAWFLICLLSCLLFTCRREEVVEQRDYPRLLETVLLSVDKSGATFRGTVASSGKSEIPDHGFVWREGSGNTPDMTDLTLNSEKLEQLSLGPLTGSAIFEATATYGLVLAKSYWVRAYLKTKDGFTVYGQPVFLLSQGSLPPTITGIQPASGVWGDTITLTGKNFSYVPKTIKVDFENGPEAKVVSSTATTIRFVVPSYLQSAASKINVQNSIGRGTSSLTFQLDTSTPVITGFSPVVATFGETITITGKNFTGDRRYWQAVFEYANYQQTTAPIASITPTEIKVLVPELSRRFYTIKLTRTNQNQAYTSAAAPQIFSQMAPVIKTVDVVSNGSYDRVKITGNNFNKPEVLFAGETAPIETFTNSELLLDPINGIYPKPTSLINVEVVSAEQKDSRQISFSYQAPWVKRASRTSGPIPSSANLRLLTAFSIKDQGYILNANDERSLQIYRFNPADYEWQRLPDLPVTSRNSNPGGSFVINEKAYILTRQPYYPYSTDFWRYDPVNHTVQINKAPDLGESSDGLVMCAMGNKGYLFTRDQAGSIWEFDSARESWARRRTNLFANSANFFSDAFSFNNKVYVVTLTYSNIGSIYSYDPGTNDWQLETNFSFDVMNSATSSKFTAYSYGGLAYLVNLREAFVFDPNAKKVTILARNRLPVNHSGGASFAFPYQKKCFLFTYNFDFWEMSPK